MRQALVTGANRGLGLALAGELLDRGAQVVACCRDPQAADALQALRSQHGQRLLLERLDVADVGAIQALPDRLAARVDKLDLLIHNAGVLVSGERFGSVQADDLAYSFAVNASAPLLLSQALEGLLRRAEQPRVLCLSSRIGSIAEADAFRTVSYAMSKAALNMAVKRMHAVLGPRGVTVLALDPGWLHTRMGGERATQEPAEVAPQLLDVADRMEAGDGGCFLARDGAVVPW